MGSSRSHCPGGLENVSQRWGAEPQAATRRILSRDAVFAAWRVHGDFFTSGIEIDPDDPPRYESESKYLLRLGLLLPGERERLCPRDFWPERIEP
jgi:hypothetical protein